MISMKKMSVLFLFAVILSSCISRPQPTPVWRPAKTTHTIEPNQHFLLLWERPIYTEVASFGNPCAVMNGILYVVGSEFPQGNANLIAIDSNDGKTRWTKESGLRFSHSENQLFIGDGKNVVSLSSLDGKQTWKTFLNHARNVNVLFYFEDKILAGASGYPFFVIEPDSGKIIAEYSSVEGFRNDYPDVPFYTDLNFQPDIIGKDAIFALGDMTYSLSRENIIANYKVWEIENDSISNPAIIENRLFYISQDDKLKMVDVDTGKMLFETGIQPSIDFFNLEKDSFHDGFYLCSDNEHRILYVILGDSRQLFAVSVRE